MLESTLSASANLSGDTGTLTIDGLGGSVSVEMQAYLTGPSANISTDTGNALQVGNDGGLYVSTLWAASPAW
jgi:hypothetical protein